MEESSSFSLPESWDADVHRGLEEAGGERGGVGKSGGPRHDTAKTTSTASRHGRLGNSENRTHSDGRAIPNYTALPQTYAAESKFVGVVSQTKSLSIPIAIYLSLSPSASLAPSASPSPSPPLSLCFVVPMKTPVQEDASVVASYLETRE